MGNLTHRKGRAGQRNRLPMRPIGQKRCRCAAWPRYALQLSSSKRTVGQQRRRPTVISPHTRSAGHFFVRWSVEATSHICLGLWHRCSSSNEALSAERTVIMLDAVHTTAWRPLASITTNWRFDDAEVQTDSRCAIWLRH